MLATPTFNNPKNQCIAEWKDQGNCCDLATLERHVRFDRRMLINSSRRMTRIYASLRNVVASFFHEIVKLSAIDPLPTTGLLNETENDAKLKGHIAAAKTFLSDMEMIHTLQIQYGTTNIFKQNSDKCWNKIADLRAASICSTCSGRASEFFRGDKGVSTVDYCTEALASCYEILRVVTRVVKIIHWILTKESTFEGIGIRIKYSMGRSIHSLLKGNGLNKGAMSVLTQYYDEFFKKSSGLGDKIQRLDKNFLMNTPATNAAICDHFLNLANKPFIWHFTRIFMKVGGDTEEHYFSISSDPLIKQLLKEKATSKEEMVEALKEDIHNKLDNWSKSSSERLLKLQQPSSVSQLNIQKEESRTLEGMLLNNEKSLSSETLMSSDVVYKDLASYSSMASTVATYIYERPMNLSLAFP